MDELSPEHAAGLARGLLEALPGGVIHVWYDGSIAAANQEASRILALKWDDSASRYVYDRDTETIGEDLRPFPIKKFPVTRALVTGKPAPAATIGMRRPNGEIIWAVFRAVPVKDPSNGRTTGAVVTFFDITERKLAEERLWSSRELLRKTQELAHIGTWEWDLVDGDVRWTEQMCEIHGVKPEDFSGKIEEVVRYIHPDDRESIDRRIGALFAGEGPHPVEYRIIRPDGTERTVSGSGETIRDENGEVVKMIGALQDITERQMLENQLRQRQRLESIGELAGGIAHDFNNLLQPIMANAEFILRGADPEQAVAEIKQAARRATDLTRRLLTVGRRQPFRPEPLDPNQIIEDIMGLLRRTLSESIEIRFEPGHIDGSIDADRGQLEQVLLNLALNARDAMLGEGKITLRTEQIPVRDGLCEAQIEVRDTGTGIPPEVQARMFEPFFTTKATGSGSGLGLAVTYGIVRKHKGRIECESQPGRGSCFRIRLPLEPRPAQSRSMQGLPSLPGGTEAILMVEDDEAVRDTGVRMLVSAGYEVIPASNATEAIELWRQHRDRIDLVFTDLVMPGNSGRALVHELRRLGFAGGVLLVTGYEPDGSPLPAPILHKPYTPEMLLSSIRKILDRRPEPMGYHDPVA